MTQIFEEIEGRVTKKLSQEINEIKYCFLCDLAELDKFLLNPQMRTYYGTVPGTSRSTTVENQEPTGDRSQNNPLPRLESSVFQSYNSFDSDRNEASQMVIGVQEKKTHCCPVTSSGKRKKARCTSQHTILQ